MQDADGRVQLNDGERTVEIAYRTTPRVKWGTVVVAGAGTILALGFTFGLRRATSTTRARCSRDGAPTDDSPKRAARVVSCVRVSNGTEGQEGSWRGVLLASRMALTATALVGSASYASFYATKHLLGISSVWNGSLSAMPCKAIHTLSSV